MYLELTDRHSLKVDETLKNKESWRSWIDQCPVSSAVYLNVTERTSLASLREVCLNAFCMSKTQIFSGALSWTLLSEPRVGVLDILQHRDYERNYISLLLCSSTIGKWADAA
ncbi:uncharacterized protein LOC141587345 [Silene latifolia]|uniref:uncharacterized protein LOC141587345 n=1 Tax=Silene latifolia TaxID=37657 RepID=UPI003D770E36